MKKMADEMDFEEFVRWATEYIVDRFLSDGLKGIRSGIHMVVNEVARNKVFGGGKK